MKTKFNYITYSLLCIVLVVFLVVVFFSPKYISIILEKESNLWAMYFGLFIAFIGIVYSLIVLFDLLVRYRYSLFINGSILSFQDAVTLKKKQLSPETIKGYYFDTYVYSWMLEAIVIETNDGQKIRVLNFFCWNFKDFQTKLKSMKIKKLGY